MGLLVGSGHLDSAEFVDSLELGATPCPITMVQIYSCEDKYTFI